MLSVGIDIGSTTIKAVVLEDNKIIYTSYERHFSRISEKLAAVLKSLREGPLQGLKEVPLAFTGSAGMGIAEGCQFPFYQEVYATRETTKEFYPDVDSIIELGGEDAKILFLNNGVEVRMNGTCAGGTGAFIDQMASLLNVSVEEINDLASKHERTYTIASRCGVFAKSDVQPLLNQGAKKEDVAESIFYAVVNQTIAGLAQGREITGKVMYLGGPLTFMSQLRKAFDDTLSVTGLLPENSLYFVAIGSALLARKDKPIVLSTIMEKVANYRNTENFAYIDPLFNNDEEYQEFVRRHEKDAVKILPLEDYKGPLYLGVDSTGLNEITSRVMGEFDRFLDTHPVDVVIVVDALASTMAAAIVTKKRGIRLAHLVAGTRSFDINMPKEINRLVIDALSDYLFTAGVRSTGVAKREQSESSNTYMVGNILMDSLRFNHSRLVRPAFIDNDKPYIVLTINRRALLSDANHLYQMMDAILDSVKDIAVIAPLREEARKLLERYSDKIQIVSSLRYLEFGWLGAHALGVISDSGNVAEEATFNGVPCITLNNYTEHQETVSVGSNVLVGEDPIKLAEEVRRMVSGDWKKCALPDRWDGRTSERIVQILIA